MNPLFYAAALGFALGSLPFAIWFGWLQKKNLLVEGSGNPGAINAFRVLGPVSGTMVLVLDAFKGAAAVFYGSLLAGFWGGLLGGAAAIFGHVCSPWLLCRGGKGIAVAAGVWLAINPLVVLVVLAAWLGAWLGSRDPYKSFAIAALTVAPAAWAITRSTDLAAAGLITSAILMLRHWRYLLD
ncbi:glycerol-3-phosphate acyltransferase [Oceanithermus sp.]